MIATLRGCLWAALIVSFSSLATRESNSSERNVSESAVAVRTRAQIEADWLRQDVVRELPPGRDVPVVMPQEDAPGACAAKMNPLVKLIDEGHYDTRLTPDDWDRLITWMDTYGQRRGSFGEDQEERLRDLRRKMAGMRAPRVAR